MVQDKENDSNKTKNELDLIKLNLSIDSLEKTIDKVCYELNTDSNNHRNNLEELNTGLEKVDNKFKNLNNKLKNLNNILLISIIFLIFSFFILYLKTYL